MHAEIENRSHDPSRINEQDYMRLSLLVRMKSVFFSKAMSTKQETINKHKTYHYSTFIMYRINNSAYFPMRKKKPNTSTVVMLTSLLRSILWNLLLSFTHMYGHIFRQKSPVEVRPIIKNYKKISSSSTVGKAKIGATIPLSAGRSMNSIVRFW